MPSQKWQMCIIGWGAKALHTWPHEEWARKMYPNSLNIGKNHKKKTSQDVLRPSLTTHHILRPHSLNLAHMFSVGINYDWNTIFSGVNGGFTIFSSMPIPHVGVCKTLYSHHFQWPGVYDVPYASQNMSKLCLETKFQGLRLMI